MTTELKTKLLLLSVLQLFSLVFLGQEVNYDSLCRLPNNESSQLAVELFNDHIIHWDSARATNTLNLLEQKAKQHNNKPIELISKGLKGIYYFHLVPTKKDSSVFLLEHALEGIKQHDGLKVIEARFTNILGYYLFRDLQFQRSLELTLISDYKFKQIGYENVENIDFYLYNIAVVYYGFNQFKKAINYLETALQYIDPKDIEGLQACYNLLGVAYSKEDKKIKAIELLQKSKSLMIKNGDSANLSTADCNIGLYYVDVAQYEKADNSFRLAYNNAMKFHEWLNATCAALGLVKLGNINNDIKETRKWLTSVDRLLIEKGIKNPTYLKMYYLQKAKLMDAIGRYKEASNLKDSVEMLNIEIDKVKDPSALVDLNVALITDKHNSQVALLEQKAEHQKATKWYIVLFSATVVVFLLYLWYTTYKKRKSEKKQHLIEQSKNLQKLNDFKSRIRDKNILLEEIKKQMEDVQSSSKNEAQQQGVIKKLHESIILTDEDWLNFKKTFDLVYPSFIPNLFAEYPELTQSEIRFLVLLKLGLSVSEMANTLAILPQSVRKTRLRLMKKVSFTTKSELKDFISKV